MSARRCWHCRDWRLAYVIEDEHGPRTVEPHPGTCPVCGFEPGRTVIIPGHLARVRKLSSVTPLQINVAHQQIVSNGALPLTQPTESTN